MAKLTEKQIIRALKRLNDNWNDDYELLVSMSGGCLRLYKKETNFTYTRGETDYPEEDVGTFSNISTGTAD